MSEPEAPKREASSRGKQLLIGGLVLGLLYVLVGFVVLPHIVASELVSLIEDQTGVEPTLADVRFNPLSWRIELEAFSLPDPATGEEAIGFDALAIDVGVLRLFLARIAVEEIVLVNPRVSAAIDEAGALNLLALVPGDEAAAVEEEPEPDADSEGGLPAVEIDSIRIERGAIDFVDRSQTPAFDVALSPLDLSIEGFTTAAGEDSPYSLIVRVGEETSLRWTGSIGLDPIRSEGEIELTRFDLRLPWDFLSEQLRFEVAGGEVDVRTRYALSLAEELSLDVAEAELVLRDLELEDPADDVVVLSMPSLEVSGVTAEVGAAGLSSLDVGAVELKGGFLHSRIEPSGEVHIATLLTPIPTPEDEEAEKDEASADDEVAESTGPAPRIAVNRIALTDFEIDIEDRSPAQPVPLKLAPFSVSVEGFTSPATDPIQLTFATGVGEGGSIAISGPIQLEPLSTQLTIDVKNIGLGEYQPYLEEAARIDVPTGTLSGALEVDFAQPAADDSGASPVIAARGRVQIDDLLTIDRRLSRRFLEWSQLRIEGLDFETGSGSDAVSIQEIALSGALAHVVIGKDSRTNIDAIFGGAGDGEVAEAEEAAPEATDPAGPGLRVDIAKVTLEGVGADFDDLSLDPHFAISLDDLTGTIEGLSSDEVAKAQVALEGRVDDVAPVRVAGQINPLSGDAYTDIQILVDGVSLPAFSPYSSRFVGYRIDRGKLGLDLSYKLNARHLEANNLVSLDQFDFGDRVESEEASTLPVGLAVAILRDPKGDIEIPLPIEGDLDDPSFSVLGLLGKTLINVVTRVATSPFAAVAGLVGASGDDLARVTFASGSDVLSDEEETELASLVKVLVDKQSLQLEIRGRADPAVDEPGLRLAKVESDLKLAAYQRMSRRARESLGDPAAVVLEADDRLDELDRLVRERIGGRAQDLVSAERMPPRGAERTRVVSEAALSSLAEKVVLNDADWRNLARSRAAAIQAAMLASDEITADRVFLVGVEVAAQSVAQDGAMGVSSELALKVD